MSSQAYPSPMPAGWYQDPASGQQRYWDGAAWSTGVAASGPQFAPVSQPGTNVAVVLGWIFAFVGPIVGLIIGVVLMGSPSTKRSGRNIAIAAGCMCAFWIFILIVGMASSGSGSGSGYTYGLAAHTQLT